MNKLSILKDRIKENFMKNKVLLIVFSIIWIGTIVVTLSLYGSSLGKESVGGENYDHTYRLYDNRVLSQTVPVVDGSKAISIKYATYIRNNKGYINIKVVGSDTDKVYLETKTNVKSLQDNAFATYSLNEALDSKIDENIIVTLSSDSKLESCAGVYYSFDSFFTDSKMCFDDYQMTGELAVRYLIDNDVYTSFYKGVMTAIIISFSLLILVLLLLDPKEEVMFTSMVLVFGLVFACIMSPGAIPDENNHYETALQVSNLMMHGYDDNRLIDKAYVNYDSFGSFINASYSYNRFMRDMNKPLKLKGETYEILKKDKYLFRNYYIVQFIPQAIGITLARLCGVNMLRTYYAGRVFNLLFYEVCIYIAIKNTPVHKRLFGILAMLPIFIQQAASMSYDCFIFGLTFISISFFMKWKFGTEQVSNKDIVIVFLASLALAPAKIVYGLFALLFLMVPTEKFGSKKRKIITMLLITCPTIFVILKNIWFRIQPSIEDFLDQFKVYAETILREDTGYEHNGGYTYSTTYILQHPIQTISIILRTVRFWLSTWFYQSIGKALAGVTLILPMSYVRAILIVIGVVTLRKENYTMTWPVRGAFVFVCLGVALFIILGMLYGWTLTTDTMIQGIQGRYFCPLLPYFFTIFNNKKIQVPEKLDKYVIYAYILLMFEIIVYILSYTFVN
ncbi:MAG: DUF2142 domain-containing protein [Erysipelotrichaceae bacterium]|nr:DUF2142 domain-containing protein [Erysipelotrichaceae bacterium]